MLITILNTLLITMQNVLHLLFQYIKIENIIIFSNIYSGIHNTGDRKNINIYRYTQRLLLYTEKFMYFAYDDIDRFMYE